MRTHSSSLIWMKLGCLGESFVQALISGARSRIVQELRSGEKAPVPSRLASPVEINVGSRSM